MMARTKPAIRVHLSVADHDKTADVWADLAMRGMLVELWRQAAEKWAGKRDDRVPLKPSDRMAIACSTSLEDADAALESLCKAMRYTLRKHPNRWVVTVRNFSKKQGFQGKELNTVSRTIGANNSTPPSPSPKSDSESESNSEIHTDRSAPDGAVDGSRSEAPLKSRKVPRPVKTPCPDRLSESDRESLVGWASARGLTESHCRWAWNAVKDWARGKGEMRADWLATTRNGIREGWALKNYAETEEERYQREMADSPFRLVTGGGGDA